MEHKLTISIPDEVYGSLVEAAQRQGRTPEEEAALRINRGAALPPGNSSNVRQATDPLESFFGSISLGHPTGADNEGIDRDLASEYAGTHEGRN